MTPEDSYSPMPNHFASQAEQALLVKLNEECSEVIKATCKAQLHGFEPYWGGVQYNNREDIERELGDVQAVRELLVRAGAVDERAIDHYYQLKLQILPRRLGWAQPPEEPYVRGVFEL